MAKVIGREMSTEVTSSEQYNTKEDNQHDQQYQQHRYQSQSDEETETVKFNIQIQSIFKRTPLEYATTNSILKRGPMTWIIPTKSLECRCPKIKLNRSYLILGKNSEALPGYLGIGPRSIVIEWKNEWEQRMKRLQRRSRTCK